MLKRLRDPADSLRLLVTTQELEELLHLMVWNYNGTPHAGLGWSHPLEMMRRHVLGIDREAIRLRLIPKPLRERHWSNRLRRRGMASGTPTRSRN